METGIRCVEDSELMFSFFDLTESKFKSLSRAVDKLYHQRNAFNRFIFRNEMDQYRLQKHKMSQEFSVT